MIARAWAALNLLGLFLSLVGGIFLFFSLTLKASNYRFIEKSDGDVAICLNDKLVATGYGGPLRITDEPCPQVTSPNVAPVIEVEKKAYVPWGLSLICLGFLMQLPAALLALFAQRYDTQPVITENMNCPDWQIECDAAVFERLKGEASFQQIVALARAVNSLQFVFDAFVADGQDTSSKAKRSRINSFLFGSAILYEGLLLVQKMNQEFGDNEVFKQGLHMLLRDPVAQALHKTHMGRGS